MEGTSLLGVVHGDSVVRGVLDPEESSFFLIDSLEDAFLRSLMEVFLKPSRSELLVVGSIGVLLVVREDALRLLYA